MDQKLLEVWIQALEYAKNHRDGYAIYRGPLNEDFERFKDFLEMIGLPRWGDWGASKDKDLHRGVGVALDVLYTWRDTRGQG